MAANVHRLGEGREIELRQPILAPKMNMTRPEKSCLLNNKNPVIG